MKPTPGQIIIYAGILIGNLEWILSAAYAGITYFPEQSYLKAQVVFLLVQPSFYLFVYCLYIGQHNDCRSMKERCYKLALSPLYMVLQQFKVLGGLELVHKKFEAMFDYREPFRMMTIENCFKVQTLIELMFSSIPLLIIQSMNSNNAEVGWSGLAKASAVIIVANIVKGVALITIYTIRRFVDNSADPPMRPRTGANLSKIEMEAFSHVQSYLIDPHDDGVDADGNTTIHQLMRFEPDWKSFDRQMTDLPHQLFMLNKSGQTPLDTTIMDSVKAEFIERGYLEKKDAEKAKEADEKEQKANQKTMHLIQRMQKFTPDCSLKFIKKPIRLDLKFEKSFAMAISQNKNDVLEFFPKGSIKSVYVSMHQLKDYKQYKEQKDGLKELLTTPLHLACLNSNMDAVRILIEHHNVDVNILINEKNFLVDLLDTSGYKDFNILNIIFKKRRPQINSGCKLALNQAILRGNPFIIKTLLEFGNPNPFVRDSNGKSPIHMAAAKLDTDTFEHLIRLGADPMMPDDDGNTFLHLMAMGVIKDAEYDFIRNAVTKFNLKLTRNNEKRTALNIIKAYSGQSTSLRGQPNYKRKIWEFYEMRQKQDSSFIENEDDLPIQTQIKDGNITGVRKIINESDGMSGKQTKEVLAFLEQRNHEGKTAFFTAVEYNQTDIVFFLSDNYPELSTNTKDSVDGNTPLHWAVRNQNYEIIELLLTHGKEKCLQTNFLGQTPFQFAVIAQDFKVLKELFADFKLQALAQRDYLGENCLFECARNGNEAIFNWFMGTNDFFKARGTQNYKGRTIEHIVCMESQHPIVDEINPRPDTPDYYGNLPLFYSLKLDDLPMLEKQFQKGKEYFTLRNYKYETVFHVAGRFNALKSIKFVIGRNVFITEMLKRDYKGDTALHLAAKAGSYEMLEFMCNSVTPGFLAIQNDFGLTPLQAALDRQQLLEEAVYTKDNTEKDYADKLQRVKRCVALLKNFDAFINEMEWNSRFDLKMDMFLSQVADANLRIFMGMPTAQDLMPNAVASARHNKQQDVTAVADEELNQL